jgi:hypothetical protein
VLRDGEGPYVFVVVQGRAEKRRVEPGIEQGADVQLVEGAADGDQVVVVGHGALRPGSLVRIAVSPTKTARAD